MLNSIREKLLEMINIYKKCLSFAITNKTNFIVRVKPRLDDRLCPSVCRDELPH